MNRVRDRFRQLAKESNRFHSPAEPRTEVADRCRPIQLVQREICGCETLLAQLGSEDVNGIVTAGGAL